MNTLSKALVLYFSVSCISGERAYGIDVQNAYRIADMALKIGILATFIYIGQKQTTILADIRDMLFEQLMNSACGANVSSDNVSLSYAQEVSEQVSQCIDAVQRNTAVSTNFYVQVPKECVDLGDDNGDDDTEDDDECDGFGCAD